MGLRRLRQLGRSMGRLNKSLNNFKFLEKRARGANSGFRRKNEFKVRRGFRVRRRSRRILSKARSIQGPLDFFLEEDGYTSITVGLALVVSLVLMFGLVAVQWSSSKAADIQNVADAAALSGEQDVKAFTTVAQVSDACVLTLGLTGMFVLGAGLITSAVPGLQEAGVSLTKAGAKILKSRSDFAKSAASGLEKLEKLLPAAIAINAFATTAANSEGNLNYLGTGIPFPESSLSQYDLGDSLDTKDLEEKSDALAKKSAEAEANQKEMKEAQERAWRADCIDDPYCMRSRADSLAHLSPAQNPHYAIPDNWSFGVALSRSRAYYQARAALETAATSSVEEQSNSAMRKAFYQFAAKEMQAGYYIENADGTVSLSLPDLPHNTEETKASKLFSETTWPKSSEGGQSILHAYSACPGAHGLSGSATLSEAESVGFGLCSVCQFDVAAMGKTASASTNINNGYEHYWRIVVEESKKYQDAKNKYEQEMKEMKGLAEEGADAFDKAIKALGVKRPRICPPGAWGVIGVVVRGETDLPQALETAFSKTQPLPEGVAIAGATLAVDANSAENTVLARFFEGTKAADATEDEDFGGALGSIFDGICGVWSSLLVGYQAGFGKISDVGNSLFDGLRAAAAGPLAGWLSNKLSSIVSALGLEPADLRLRKPVLCNTQDILSKDGFDISRMSDVVQALPSSGSLGDLLASFSRQVSESFGEEEISIADLPIPGTSIKIPLTISVKKLLGVL